jgi:hypothetical protein
MSAKDERIASLERQVEAYEKATRTPSRLLVADQDRQHPAAV